MTRPARSLAVLESLVQLLPDSPSQFAEAAARVSDWPSVIATAHGQGMLGVLGGAVHRLRVGIPDESARKVERQQAVASVWHAHQMHVLESILATLESRAIRAAALKGPWLAVRLYEHPAERHSVDLDVLVSAADLDAAVGALVRAGWSIELGPAANYARQHHHHLQLVRSGSPTLELHFRARAGFGTVFEAAPLLERAIEMRTPGGHSVFTLSPEDEFIYLAVHAAAHGFVRLMWLYDLKLLRHANPPLDWSVVAQRAAAIGVRAPVAFACRLMHERFLMPRAVEASLVAAGPRHALAAAVQRRVEIGDGPLALDRLGGLTFTSLLSSGPLAATRLWLHHAMRVIKRRVQRAAPRLVSPDWAG